MNAYDDERAPLAAGSCARCWPRRCAPSCPPWGSAWAASCWRWPPAAGSARPRRPSTARSWWPSGRPPRNDPLFRELPITPDVLQWHVDEVSAAAAGRGAAGRLAGLRGAGVPGRPAGLGHPVPHRDHARDRDRLGPQTTPSCWPTTTCAAILDRAVAAHPDIAEVWQPVVAAVRRDRRRSGRGRAAGVQPRLLPMAGHAATVSTAEPITDPAAIRAALAAELQASREPSGH